MSKRRQKREQKQLKRNGNLVQTKNGLESTKNRLGKPFRKKSDPNIRENSKIQSEIATPEQKNHKRESELLFKHHFLTLL